MESLEVIRPGSQVLLGEEHDYFEAVVACVDVGIGNRVLYRCSWWIGREFKDVWVDAAFVRPAAGRTEKLSVGFRGPAPCR